TWVEAIKRYRTQGAAGAQLDALVC
ncbi:MAG: hypothetical protein JWM87_3127, partial [Candidatus Eremiobacteraeota bacterium]|nr:hypothetical protein [Candidatus Eremiobacteraeota bacterium]